MADLLRSCLIGTSIVFCALAFVILVLTCVLDTPDKFKNASKENGSLKFLSSFFSTSDVAVTETANDTSLTRTVILLHKEVSGDQHVFIRGGRKLPNIRDCHHPSTQKSTECSIPLLINPVAESLDFASYNAWSVGDSYIDWLGAEEGQNTYNGTLAQGTPLAWTTNLRTQDGYQDVNKYGDDYWMLDAMIDCNFTEDGWFEFRGLVDYNSTHIVLEEDISQVPCTTSAEGEMTPPFKSAQHVAKCGVVNVFRWSEDECFIAPISTQ